MIAGRESNKSEKHATQGMKISIFIFQIFYFLERVLVLPLVFPVLFLKGFVPVTVLIEHCL